MGLAPAGRQKPLRQTQAIRPQQKETTIYVATDAVNGIIQVLVPRNEKLHVEHLRLDNPDLDNTDAAEYRLLETAMDNTRIDI